MSDSFLNVLRVIVLAGLGLAVYWMMGGFGVPSFRYKLSMAVETPDGIKTAYNVVEVSHYSVSIPAQGTTTHTRGEALYLDIGPERRPLIALITGPRDRRFDKTIHWGEGSPFDVLAHLYGETFKTYGRNNENIYKLVQYRGARQVAPSSGYLPVLVTFANVNDPQTVMLVDPDDLSATLGPDIKWHEITLEITDEPLTAGIETKLPWLTSYYNKVLSGKKGGERSDGSIADELDTGAFQRSGSR